MHQTTTAISSSPFRKSIPITKAQELPKFGNSVSELVGLDGVHDQQSTHGRSTFLSSLLLAKD